MKDAPDHAYDRSSSETISVPPSPESGGPLKSVTVTTTKGEAPTGRPSIVDHEAYVGCTIDDRYYVEAILGEGGMGVVYRCRHTIIGKLVAMKVLRADLARNDEVTERFLNEAKSASAIGNPHIIDISDFGRLPDGSAYFIMEFLDGIPVTDIVEPGRPVAAERIVHIAQQLAEGLYAAHEAGIVHRDLKPDNIFLVSRGAQKDFIKILDFGIAKANSTEGKLTQAGAIFGTPHYMSPEQAAGAPLDHRSDIYSLGVILYELASGKVPFDADNFMGILTQHMYKSPVPIRALVPQPQDIPPGLEAIILKCLSKRAEQRYSTMEELHADLDKLAAGNVPDAVSEMMNRSGGFNVPQDYFKRTQMPAPMPATPASLQKNKWPLYVGIGGVVTTVALVLGIFAQSSSSDAASASQSTTAALAAPEPPPPTPEPAKPEPEAQPEPEVPAAPVTTQVVIAIDPLDAHVFRGEEDLGTSPVLLDVPDGEKIELTVKRKGYRSAELTVDGSETKRTVELKRVTSTYVPRPAPPKAVAPKPKKSTIGGGEIVNPWN